MDNFIKFLLICLNDHPLQWEPLARGKDQILPQNYHKGHERFERIKRIWQLLVRGLGPPRSLLGLDRPNLAYPHLEWSFLVLVLDH